MLKDIIVGQQAADLRHSLDIQYPMENGIIRNWDDMELLWDHTFGNECLNIDPTLSKILLTEAPMNPKKNRERLVETMFEKYGFQGTSFTLFASEKMSIFRRLRCDPSCPDTIRAGSSYRRRRR